MPASEDTTFATCGICCEEKRALLSFSQCHHETCQECLFQWIETAENTGQTTPPGCPLCRVPLSIEDMERVLGRPFTPSKKMECPSLEDTSNTLDELTLHWLQANAKACPGCGNYIEKNHGCNHMTCLCGVRFCYGCGWAGRCCVCIPTDWDDLPWNNSHHIPQEWLSEAQAQYAPCPGCGNFLETMVDQDHWECLCGVRFCYRCGWPGRLCTCDIAEQLLPEDEFLTPVFPMPKEPQLWLSEAEARLRQSNGKL
jgi:Zinc finger, C3HC4 type (RING finger)